MIRAGSHWVERLQGSRPWGLRLLVLAVSERCDQRCVHCQIWMGPRAAAPALSLEERLAVVEEALRAGAREALLTGGEPLLSPDLWPLAERLRSGRARLTLATNGMQLERHAAALAGTFDELYVSLDGASPASHDGLRGVAAFERLRAGLAALRGRAPRPRLVARPTLHARNLHEIEGLVAAARGLGFDRISFLPLDASSAAFGGTPAARAALVPGRAQVESLEQGLARLEARGELGAFVVEDRPRLGRLVAHLESGAGLRPFERPACDSPWWSLVVEADGAVRPCFFHAPAGDARDGLLAVRGSRGYREALQALRRPNATCERCVCPSLRGPAWLGALARRLGRAAG